MLDEFVGRHRSRIGKIASNQLIQIRHHDTQNASGLQRAEAFLSECERLVKGEMLKRVRRINKIHSAIAEWQSLKHVVPMHVFRPRWNLKNLAYQRYTRQPDRRRVVYVVPTIGHGSSTSNVHAKQTMRGRMKFRCGL